MTSERWQQVVSLFNSALERDSDARAEFIAHACASDAALRGEVESLLAADDRSAGFIEDSAFAVAARQLNEADESFTGQRIGQYRIVNEIGRGGMGAVYLAVRDDDEYQKRVAIKMIKRGLDTDFILRRFRTERQILADLDHPNIARLLDGGSLADGRPFLVMEYVEGLPVNDYANAHKLSIIERLNLFRAICAAVQYAHQHLIIHRDLKPTNILITPDGAPKLLDFGIAKLLHAEAVTQHTETVPAQRIMTPDYASPEQVQGLPVTTATDVYSLGVVLYELLTGQRPFQFKSRSPVEVTHVICEREPLRPSIAAVSRVKESRAHNASNVQPAGEASGYPHDEQPEKLRRRLRGDLDNIILKAMRKEPARRYASIEQFSEDLRRYLEGLPVIARPDTLSYRATKFITRHKAGVAAALIIALTLIAATAVSLRQAHLATQQARRAERVSAFMQNIFLLANKRFNSPGRDLKGEKMSAAELLDEASKRIDTELADQPEVRAELHHTLGDTYLTFNRFDAAEPNFRAALALSREVYGEQNPKVAQELYYLAAALQSKDEMSEADKLFSRAITMMRATDAENANLPYMLQDYAGLRMSEYGDAETAESLLRESLSLFKRRYGEDFVMVPLLNNSLASVAEQRNELDKAKALYMESIAKFQRLSASTHQNNQSAINDTNIALARIAIKRGDYAEAETILSEALNHIDESSPDYYRLTSNCDEYRAQLHYLRHEYDKAEAKRRRVLEIQRSILPADHRSLIHALCLLSQVLSKEGKQREAISYYNEAREIYDKRADQTPLNDNLKGTLGECLTALGRYSEAEPLLRESYNNLKAHLGAQHSYTIEAQRRLTELDAARTKSK